MKRVCFISKLLVCRSYCDTQERYCLLANNLVGQEVIFQGLFPNLSAICLASSDVDNKYYTGAVVEFAPDRWNKIEKGEEVILRNAKRYKQIIEEAGKHKVDIIVFPEAGLTTIDLPAIRDQFIHFATYIPNVEDKVIPCKQLDKNISQHLKLLSCAAIEQNLYIVINLLEKVKCDITNHGCPADGLLLYNTNFVLDRSGKIIAKYRKFNLFIEPETNVTSSAELVTFDTDFGVRFGTFICFDILFREPAITLLERTNVRNIVYPTAWFSELPHLTASAVQSGYSYSQNINLLASGYNRPGNKNAGSGIFASKRGPLEVVMPDEEATKLIVARLPADPDRHSDNLMCTENDLYCERKAAKIIDFKEFDRLNKLFYYNENDKNLKGLNFFKEDLSIFSTQNFSYNNENAAEKESMKVTKLNYQHDGFSCEIIVKWEKSIKSDRNGPFYRLVGYAGERSYSGIRTVRIEVCSIIACKDEQVSSCGLQPNFETGLTDINSIFINIQSPYSSNPYAVTLNKDFLPLGGDEISFTKQQDLNNNLLKATMVLEKSCNDLITFGIYKTE